MISLDSSGLFAYLNRRDKDHERVRAALADGRGPWLVPAPVLCETAYLLEQRAHTNAVDALLTDFERGVFAIDCGEHDFVRVRELVRRYADLPLGLVDASVIACAERNGGRVLTLDKRHFGVVAREGRILVYPE